LEEEKMAMASGSGVRAVCGALMAVMGVVFGISGVAAGDLVGSEQIGASDADDAASMATDGAGHRLWSRQPGTSDDDTALGVATDEDGNVYVAGSTGGALGGPNKGGSDAWVIKFDGAGHRLWTRQPGTSASDAVLGVATDTDGSVYVVGYTSLGPGDADAFVIKLGSDGHLLWRRQPGTSDAQDVATDEDGNVYVVGGTCIRCDTDAWVTKYDGAGHPLWTRQPGTSGFDRAYDVAIGGEGDVYVVGETEGALGGPNKGPDDTWVIKYTSAGDLLWKRQPGTSDHDYPTGVATDTDSNVYVVGVTGVAGDVRSTQG
jgi:hypothetical protein